MSYTCVGSFGIHLAIFKPHDHSLSTSIFAIITFY
jgi:hypothetical protein